MGRPKKNKEKVLSESLNIAVTKIEKKRIEKIVGIKEISINQLIRDILNPNLETIEKELDIT